MVTSANMRLGGEEEEADLKGGTPGPHSCVPLSETLNSPEHPLPGLLMVPLKFLNSAKSWMKFVQGEQRGKGS